MAKFEYVGAIENINEIQLKFIGEVLEKKGYKDTKVQIEVLGEAGDNYMANVKRIIVKDLHGKPFKMVAKIASGIEHVRMMTNTHDIFVNETMMYTEVLPKYRQIQHEVEVPDNDILKFAECYGCLTDAPNEIIILEDLKEKNFAMLDRFKSLSDECVKYVLKNIAILHSLSFVLQTKEPQFFEEKSKNLSNLWSKMPPEVMIFFVKIENFVIYLLHENENRTDFFKRAEMMHHLQSATDIFNDPLTKHKVIIQGDAWTNNIMFKFDGETLLDSILIDYQLSRLCTPVYDIMYVVLNCTDHQTRLMHYYDWIDYYHTELARALSKYGFKASSVYPRDQLDADIKRHGKIIFSLSVLLTNMMTVKSEDAAKFKDVMLKSGKIDELPIKLEESANVLLFKRNIEGLIDSCIEFGLF